MHPTYGILTKIGTAHLDSFGSEENIRKGKFELIESLPSDGIGVLNGDDELQTSYKLKNDCKIVYIGIDNPNVDFRAINIKLSNKGTSFDCVFKGEKETVHFETRLLGKANIYYKDELVSSIDIILNNEYKFSLWSFLLDTKLIYGIGLILLFVIFVFIKRGKKKNSH